ncbi:MAG: hypothetical protein B7X90_17310 [Novosphingobium sp. 17-62-19]|uniref:WYL domain-containing protein n=1 Tax=Novosphingobium sp. 17-62-19 TaxID=1970406 RepID=UPI000BC7DF12|nr:WYL domain-containing protein [Novosphingobium sp. 17-62-19]OZA16734.1 MAG: hypothetical protein B7X90_17310 [Novosphingobium sp. 17-62-19]HQS98166.1 WYL domain-containing protein [Novosphingobium sp.]
MRSDKHLALTRRAFATGLSGSLAALPATAHALADANQKVDLNDPDMRDAALRGLARAGERGDPVLAAKAEATLARLQASDPEAAMLVQVYKAYDVDAAVHRYNTLGSDSAAAPALALLHSAIQHCRAVSFHYTDLEDQQTSRTALPLAIVHPAQGIKLLAWCEKRGDIRQFFVRSMGDLTVGTAGFGPQRLSLLQKLADSAALRA